MFDTPQVFALIGPESSLRDKVFGILQKQIAAEWDGVMKCVEVDRLTKEERKILGDPDPKEEMVHHGARHIGVLNRKIMPILASGSHVFCGHWIILSMKVHQVYDRVEAEDLLEFYALFRQFVKKACTLCVPKRLYYIRFSYEDLLEDKRRYYLENNLAPMSLEEENRLRIIAAGFDRLHLEEKERFVPCDSHLGAERTADNILADLKQILRFDLPPSS